MTNAEQPESQNAGSQTTNPESTKSLGESTTEPQPLPPSALSPDAPLHHLLSLRHNPMVKDMTQAQLMDFIKTLSVLSTSAPSLSAKLASDGQKIVSTRTQSKRKAILDSI